MKNLKALTEEQYKNWLTESSLTCMIEENFVKNKLHIRAIRVSDLPKNFILGSRIPEKHKKISEFTVNTKHRIL